MEGRDVTPTGRTRERYSAVRQAGEGASSAGEKEAAMAGEIVQAMDVRILIKSRTPPAAVG
jgi:hypothetical protein